MVQKLLPYAIALVLGGGALVYLVFLQAGTLLLLPIKGHTYRVTVDGAAAEVVPKGRVLEVSVRQGSRHVRIEDTQGGSFVEHDLKIANAAHPYVAAVDRDQCFLEFDFTDFYGPKAKEKIPPLRANDKHLDGKPFQTSRETRFSVSELPETKREHMPQFVLRDVGCQEYASGKVDLAALLAN